MASGKIACGVEISGTAMRVVLLATRPVPTVMHCEEVAIQPGDEPRVGAVVARILERFNVRRADIHLVFSPPHPAPGRHHIFAAPKLSRSELVQVASRELKRDGTLDPNNAYYSVDTLDLGEEQVEGGQRGQRYLLVALAREPVDVAAMSMLESKLIVRTATTSAIGVMRAAQATDIPPTGIVALAQLDIRRSTLVVLENGVPRFFRDIPTSFAKGGREGADDALIAQALARELDISLVFFAQQNRPKQVDTIMIVGDAEVADRVSEWLEDSQTYKVIRFGPTDRLRVQPNVTPNLLPYAAAIGATLPPRRGTPSSDLLPAELRGRPERVVATVVAAILTVLLVAVILHKHNIVANRADRAEARLLAARSTFIDMQRQVAAAAEIDQEAIHSDQWRNFFDHADLYHKRLGNFVYRFSQIIPSHARLSAIDLATPTRKLSPLQIKKGGNMHASVNGIVRAPDIQGAQGDILRIFHQTETLTPEVLRATLTPLVASPPGPSGIEMSFEISVNILNLYRGHP